MSKFTKQDTGQVIPDIDYNTGFELIEAVSLNDIAERMKSSSAKLTLNHAQNTAEVKTAIMGVMANRHKFLQEKGFTDCSYSIKAIFSFKPNGFNRPFWNSYVVEQYKSQKGTNKVLDKIITSTGKVLDMAKCPEQKAYLIEKKAIVK